MSAGSGPIGLRAAVGAYPHTSALMDGRISSNLLTLDFASVTPISRAFAPMVRDLRFDVSEMAIATFLQAKACGKALVLLPVVLAARFQEAALLCRADSSIRGPADLAGKRVGVRAYSQTTGMWLRGSLAETYGVQPSDIQWSTFEDAHVAEIRDPAWAERASAGSELLPLLEANQLDAVIVGNDLPADAGLRPVFADAKSAGEAFFQRHAFVPVNHMVAMRRELAVRHPELVTELLAMFRSAASLAHAENGWAPPFGRTALRPAMELALRYMTEQGMLPRPLDLEEVWDGLPDIRNGE